MLINWYEEFLQKLREFRTHCADTLRSAEYDDRRLNTQSISRAIDALERHWKKQFPKHTLPRREDIERHLRIGQFCDVLDLMTKDIHDAEVKALAALGDRRPSVIRPYVSLERIEELTSIQVRSEFDLTKVVRLCTELNTVSEMKCHISTAALVRALLDHIPPVFDKHSFSEVATSDLGSRSFKESAKNLQESSRKIADGLLHTKIRAKESLPTATQVDFSQAVDVLLGEVVRVLRERSPSN